MSPNKYARLYAAKKVISLTNRAADKNVQNSICMPCNQIPEIKLIKGLIKEKLFIYKEPFPILVRYIKSPRFQDFPAHSTMDKWIFDYQRKSSVEK